MGFLKFERDGDFDLDDGKMQIFYRIIKKRDNDVLGIISWDKEWKEWVASFDEETKWSKGCLSEIAEKLGDIKRLHYDVK